MTPQELCRRLPYESNIPQDAINEVYVFFFNKISLYSDILLKNINFIYSIDRIVDFYRAESTCYRINSLYASSG